MNWGRLECGSSGHGWGSLAVFCFCLGVIASMQFGCLEPFDPYWSVDKYRVLGMKSDPATVEPGGRAEVSVLDYVPPGTDVTYEWSWCPVDPPAQNRYECPIGELQNSADAGADSVDAGGGVGAGAMPIDPALFDLGTGETATLPYFGTPDELLDFCRQIQRAVAGAGAGAALGGTLATADCREGYPVAIRLEAKTDSGAREIAKKKVTFSTGGDEPNSNPIHRGIEIRVSKASDAAKVRGRLDWVPPAGRPRSEQWYVLPEDSKTPVLAGMTYDVRARVGAESAERWTPPPPRGGDESDTSPQRERLTFRWLVSKGTIGQTQRIFIPGTNDLAEIRKTEVTVEPSPPKACTDGDGSAGGGGSDSERCVQYVWSVVRDSRGGLNWAERRLEIVGAASSEERQ